MFTEGAKSLILYPRGKTAEKYTIPDSVEKIEQIEKDILDINLFDKYDHPWEVLPNIKEYILTNKIPYSVAKNEDMFYKENDFNLKIEPNKKVAIVGKSGQGKSTLFNLITKLFNVTKGSILIDGIDLRDYTLESLRQNIAVVFQDNFLFSGTIRENILLGRPDASEKEIYNAVEMAYLNDFIASLKNGIDTQIGERGILLSNKNCIYCRNT